MDHIQIRDRVKEITDVFGMKQSILAKAMNCSIGTIKQKFSDAPTTRNRFNQKNLDDLINYLKTEAEKL